MKAGAHLSAGSSQRGRCHGAAMKAAIKYDDVSATCRVTRESQSRFNCFGTGVGKRHGIDRPRHSFRQLVRQVQHGLVRDGGVLRVHDLADLFARRCNHFGMTMAGTGNPNAGSEVQIALAVDVKQPATFAALYAHLTGLLQQR